MQGLPAIAILDPQWGEPLSTQSCSHIAHRAAPHTCRPTAPARLSDVNTLVTLPLLLLCGEVCSQVTGR